ncbi:hypothetical protein SAMN04488561_1494 [Jiangella alba]|uniref:Uncharacterized protein n=1 Tax=Jiangella alba TaxID=561176 RepID=A0A1H5JAN0_9ACTN|nr:hypothetical protein SAMN04488561_1494 [Jiangella alba]
MEGPPHAPPLIVRVLGARTQRTVSTASVKATV